MTCSTLCIALLVLQALDKGASSFEIGVIIGIASLTLTIFAPIVGYFVSIMITVMTLPLMYYGR